MVSGTFTRTVIFDEHLYVPGGIVYDWMNDVGKEYSRACKVAAPIRTGHLKRSIRMSMRGRGAGKTVQTTIGTSASYAMFVLKGTTGPIMSDKLWAYGGVLRKGRGLRKVTYTYRSKKTGRMRKRVIWVPEPGTMLAVGRNPWPPRTPMFEVSGQRPNRFMERAWRVVAAQHRALPAFPLDI